MNGRGLRKESISSGRGPYGVLYPRSGDWVALRCATLLRTCSGLGSSCSAMLMLMRRAEGEAPSAATVVGIFGYFGELVLAFSAAQALAPIPVFDVWAQDLVGTTLARNVTGEVRWADGGASLVLPGTVITQIGQEGRSSADDVSPPGLVVRLAPHS